MPGILFSALNKHNVSPGNLAGKALCGFWLYMRLIYGFFGGVGALSFPGICAPSSEAAVRSGAQRDSSKEWKTLREEAPQPKTGERNLPATGGHPALSVRSRCSSLYWKQWKMGHHI